MTAISFYLKKVARFETCRKLACTACGYGTAAMGDIAICSNCEYIAGAAAGVARQQEEAQPAGVARIRELLAASKYKDAVDAYRELNKTGKELNLLHGEAAALTRLSNQEIAQIRYDLEGFMDENTAHRDRAAGFASQANRAYARIAGLVEDSMAAGNRSHVEYYSLFVARLRLGLVRGAMESAMMLFGIGNEFMGEYALMALNSSNGRYAEVMNGVEKFIVSQEYPLNMFYYLAFAMFKSGKRSDARVLLERLKALISSRNVEELILEMGD